VNESEGEGSFGRRRRIPFPRQLVGLDAIEVHEDQADRDADDRRDQSHPSQSFGSTVSDGVADRDKASEHQHDAEDDREVDRHPHPAVGDDAGHSLRIVHRRDRVDEVPRHPQEGARQQEKAEAFRALHAGEPFAHRPQVPSSVVPICVLIPNL
jgi:hypothetical protein